MLSVLWLTLSVDGGVHSLISQAVADRVPVQDFFGDRAPTFQIWVSSAVDQADQMATVPDRHLLATYMRCYNTTAANQAESEKISLYSSLSSEIDYKSLMAEHTLSFADYGRGCQVSSTLLGNDK